MIVAGKHASESLRAKIEDLQARGAERVDSLRLVQLRALWLRQDDQPEPVQLLLREKIASALAELEQRFSQAPEVAKTSTQNPSRNAPRAALQASRSAWPSPVPKSDELASVSRFRRAWSGIRARDSVTLAASQKPNNAGPLNSHVLMAQSLDMMRALPGDYLRRFVAHAEALLWLEANAAPDAASPKRKTKRPSRPRKSSS